MFSCAAAEEKRGSFLVRVRASVHIPLSVREGVPRPSHTRNRSLPPPVSVGSSWRARPVSGDGDDPCESNVVVTTADGPSLSSLVPVRSGRCPREKRATGLGDTGAWFRVDASVRRVGRDYPKEQDTTFDHTVFGFCHKMRGIKGHYRGITVRLRGL